MADKKHVKKNKNGGRDKGDQPYGDDSPVDLARLIRVTPGESVHLKKIDPAGKLGLPDKDEAVAQSVRDADAIDALQDALYAEGTQALLVVLQGMDTSGKDGTIKHVFNTAGPLGVAVTAFRKPSEIELAHDFLWRAHAACPRRGMIGVFNRSHYEDVLVASVRKLAPEARIDERYEQINAFEKMLSENGTTVLKFMLHVSKDEQRQRLQERLDDPRKYWKFNPGDLDDRKLWSDFQAAYETAVTRCSTPWAPWHVVPSDHKWVRHAAVASVIRATLSEMAPAYPKATWKQGEFEIT